MCDKWARRVVLNVLVSLCHIHEGMGGTKDLVLDIL